MESIFTDIYDHDLWGKVSKSGTSSGNFTVSLRSNLERFLVDYNINTILDVPCGDNSYISLMNLENYLYLGMDIVETNIKLHRENYPEKYYFHYDIIMDFEMKGEKFDLIITRALLQHLPQNDAIKTLKNLFTKGKYILLTTFLAQSDNHDISIGKFYFVDMFRKPFCFNEPLMLFPDFNLQNGDKNLMYAGIWEISKIKHCLPTL